jgi:hypothetical protein
MSDRVDNVHKEINKIVFEQDYIDYFNYLSKIKYQYSCCDNNVEHCFEVFEKHDECFDCEHEHLCETLEKRPECKNKKGASKFCDEDCYYCYNRSFASHYRSRYWSDENELLPRFVSKNSHKNIKFKCDKPECSHDIILRLDYINLTNRWCSYCVARKFCDDKCYSCFIRSFASSPKSKLWHPTKNGNLTPKDVALHSGKLFWFLCDKPNCLHEYQTIPNSDSDCLYCKHRKLCDDKDNCNMCFNNSFASYPLSKFWDYKKNFPLTPRDIFRGTTEKYFNIKSINKIIYEIINVITLFASL